MDLHFKLSMESANIVMKWLGKGPFDEVATVVADLQAQAAPQLAAQQQQQAAPPPPPLEAAA